LRPIGIDVVVSFTRRDQKSSIFIKTDQLDGETDWKARKPATDQVPVNFTVEINPPVPGIYNFSGTLTLEDSERVDLGSRVGVGLEQTLWRGVKVAVGKILLLVIYTGR
jgi:phospholipid-translocating ATPase